MAGWGWIMGFINWVMGFIKGVNKDMTLEPSAFQACSHNPCNYNKDNVASCKTCDMQISVCKIRVEKYDMEVKRLRTELREAEELLAELVESIMSRYKE
mgnify:CR=1 FL=1